MPRSRLPRGDRSPAALRRVLGYARVSSEEQSRGTSLQDQQDAIRAFAKARGMIVARMYVESESGIHEKIERRTQIRLLQDDVASGDLVVCDKLDRWSRDPEFTLRSVREILEKGGGFYSVSEQCDPSTREGDMMLGLRSLFAKQEHQKIRDRLVGTRELLRDRGYYAEGLPPFGYRRQAAKGHKHPEKNALLIVPEDAAKVRRAFRLCIAGRSLAQIAETLGLQKDRVAHLLANRNYLGIIQDTSGQWIKARHEAIIDADTFELARAARDGRTHGGPRENNDNAETRTWILRDVARCLHCDAKMKAVYGGEGAGRRHYYGCRKRCTSKLVRVGPIEAAAEPLLVARLGVIREEMAKGPAPVKRPAAPDTTSRRAKIASRRANFVEMRGDGQIDREALRIELAKLDAEQLRLDAIDAATARVSPLVSPAVRREILRLVSEVARAWRGAGPVRRRQIVNMICEAMRMAFGLAPRPVWRSNEKLAAGVQE